MQLQSVISESDSRTAYVYAETAFHHEGDFSYLEDLVDAAAEAGVDGIKFQVLLDADSAYSDRLPTIGKIRSWCFDQDQWLSIIGRARARDLEVVVMPIDSASVAFAIENLGQINGLEIHSICFNEEYMLDAMSISTRPILLNIGGRSIAEIAWSLDRLTGRDTALIYGLQNFPTDPAGIHLARIPNYSRTFGRCVGYADHTTANSPELGSRLACYAYLLGCRIFERHITTERNSGRVDHEAAVLPAEIKTMIDALEQAAETLGDGRIHRFTTKDQQYRNRQKQIVFTGDLPAGELIRESKLTFMVTPEASDFDQIEFSTLLGRRLSRAVRKYEPVRYADIDGTGE